MANPTGHAGGPTVPKRAPGHGALTIIGCIHPSAAGNTQSTSKGELGGMGGW